MILDQRSDRIRRLCAFSEPVLHALGVDLNDRRLGARVVMSEDFDERTVARGARVGDHDTEEGSLLGPGPSKTDDYHDRSLWLPPALPLPVSLSPPARST